MIKSHRHVEILAGAFDPNLNPTMFRTYYKELSKCNFKSGTKTVFSRFKIEEWRSSGNPTQADQLDLLNLILDSCKRFQEDSELLAIHLNLLTHLLKKNTKVLVGGAISVILQGVINGIIPSMLIE